MWSFGYVLAGTGRFPWFPLLELAETEWLEKMVGRMYPFYAHFDVGSGRCGFFGFLSVESM